MRGYSLDLRERIVAAVASGEGPSAVSRRFAVSLATVKRYLKRQERGELAPCRRGGRRRRLTAEGCERLRQQVETHPDWTLEQRAAALVQETGINLKKSAVGNYLKRLGITHKKRALSPVSAMKGGEPAI